MRSTLFNRKTLLATALVVGLAPAISSVAATRAGSLQVNELQNAAYSDDVPISWKWKRGTKVTSTSSLYFQASNDRYRWRTIDQKIPIRHGTFTWDTTEWPEGVYYVRGVVHRTTVLDVVGPITVDRTSPLTRITEPSEGDVIVEDALSLYGSVIVGTTTLEADAFDFGSGISSLEWFLDGEPIGSGTPLVYNFSMTPGQHELTVEAVDGAGNTETHSVQIVTAPGPSLVVEELPEPGDGPEPPEGVPSPDDLPGLPDDAPGLPGEVPSPDPSDLPAPSPDDIPEPPTAPDPGSIPPALPDPGLPT